jgi:hypothetical protein
VRSDGRSGSEVELAAEVITGLREVQAGSWNTRKPHVLFKSANFKSIFLANSVAIDFTSIIFHRITAY